MGQNLINQLRDIHYPSPIPIWPLAVGWYVVIALIITGLLIGGYFWLKAIKKHRVKRIVLKRLDELQKQQAGHQDIAEELSMLLKRAALATFPRSTVAGLHGEAWLHFLDNTAMTKEFSEGSGRLLLICPYQGKAQQLPEQLFHLIKNWVKKNL